MLDNIKELKPSLNMQWDLIQTKLFNDAGVSIKFEVGSQFE